MAFGASLGASAIDQARESINGHGMVDRSASERARDPGGVVLGLLAALAVWDCGGKSVSIQGDDGDPGGVRGGSNAAGRGDGGRGGVSGATAGGAGTAAVAGVTAGGSVGFGGGAGFGGSGGSFTGGVTGTGGDGCDVGTFTHIVGTVRDPAGKTPLYNVLVFVPSGPLAALPEGAHCDSCSTMIDPRPLETALTDTHGNFRLVAPPGRDVPVVIQSGKWRREITVPFVTPCVDNFVDDPELLRLPRTRSEGHMPRLAVVTGAEDSLECFLRRVGIADSEFTAPGGPGAVNLFVGCDGGSGTGTDRFDPALGGAAFPSVSDLLASPAALSRYDYVLLGCEGSACGAYKSAYLENVESYANGGGRLLLDHLQDYWMKNGSAALRATAEFDGGHESLLQTLSISVDQTFPKGFALAEWLVNVGASDTVGELVLRDAGASVPAIRPPTQRWLYAPSIDGTFSMTVNMPVAAPVEQQCGRITYLDFHASSPDGDVSLNGVGFPNGCKNGPLSPQEAAMEFQLFDFSACVTHGGGVPVPPPL